jgi:hypothetical protein
LRDRILCAGGGAGRREVSLRLEFRTSVRSQRGSWVAGETADGFISGPPLKRPRCCLQTAMTSHRGLCQVRRKEVPCGCEEYRVHMVSMRESGAFYRDEAVPLQVLLNCSTLVWNRLVEQLEQF